jgi:hypothetical protein
VALSQYRQLLEQIQEVVTVGHSGRDTDSPELFTEQVKYDLDAYYQKNGRKRKINSNQFVGSTIVSTP